MLTGDDDADLAEVNAALRHAFDFFVTQPQPNPTRLVIPRRNWALMRRDVRWRVALRRLRFRVRARPRRFRARVAR